MIESDFELMVRKERKRSRNPVVLTSARMKMQQTRRKIRYTNDLENVPKGKRVLSLDYVYKILRLDCRTTIVRAFGKIWRQKSGAPMGSPASSTYADLATLPVERSRRLGYFEGMREKGWQVLIWRRYVDDVLTIAKKIREDTGEFEIFNEYGGSLKAKETTDEKEYLGTVWRKCESHVEVKQKRRNRIAYVQDASYLKKPQAVSAASRDKTMTDFMTYAKMYCIGLTYRS